MHIIYIYIYIYIYEQCFMLLKAFHIRSLQLDDDDDT